MIGIVVWIAGLKFSPDVPMICLGNAVSAVPARHLLQWVSGRFICCAYTLPFGHATHPLHHHLTTTCPS